MREEEEEEEKEEEQENEEKEEEEEEKKKEEQEGEEEEEGGEEEGSHAQALFLLGAEPQGSGCRRSGFRERVLRSRPQSWINHTAGEC